MPQCDLYQQSDFPAHLKWQALSFMRTQWPSIFTGPLRWLSETYPPEMHPIHFTLHEGEVLISYAAAMQLSLAHQGTTYQVYGFGNVFTFPPYRHEGHGQRLMRAAAGHLDRSGMDLAMLFCHPALAAWYARSGWESCSDEETRIGSPDSYTVDQDLRMVRYISSRAQQARNQFQAHPLYLEWAW